MTCISNSRIDDDELWVRDTRVIRDDDPTSQLVFDAIKAVLEDVLNGTRIEPNADL